MIIETVVYPSKKATSPRTPSVWKRRLKLLLGVYPENSLNNHNDVDDIFFLGGVGARDYECSLRGVAYSHDLVPGS